MEYRGNLVYEDKGGNPFPGGGGRIELYGPDGKFRGYGEVGAADADTGYVKSEERRAKAKTEERTREAERTLESRYLDVLEGNRAEQRLRATQIDNQLSISQQQLQALISQNQTEAQLRREQMAQQGEQFNRTEGRLAEAMRIQADANRDLTAIKGFEVQGNLLLAQADQQATAQFRQDSLALNRRGQKLAFIADAVRALIA